MSDVEEDLTLRARRLPRSIEPDRDLWPGIQAGLETADRSASPFGGRWIATAAALVMAATVGFFLGDAADRPVGEQVATVEPGTAVPVGLSVAADLSQTRRNLVAHVYQELGNLPPDTQAVVLENLTTINLALDEIDGALKEAPESGLSRRLLMTMYADQLAMLSDMSALVRASNREIAL